MILGHFQGHLQNAKKNRTKKSPEFEEYSGHLLHGFNKNRFSYTPQMATH